VQCGLEAINNKVDLILLYVGIGTASKREVSIDRTVVCHGLPHEFLCLFGGYGVLKVSNVHDMLGP